MRKTEWTVFACALFAGHALVGQEGSCQISHDLFERRSALIAQIGAYERETDQSKELRSINEKYFQLMSGLESRAEPGAKWQGGKCCEDVSHDPIANLLCKISAYLGSDRKESAILLESVPTGPRGREALWALDAIAHLHDSDNSEKRPVLFGPYGPVTLYLEELYRLVRSGNEEALSKYLGLYPYSDGEHAEQMDDQMKKFLTSDIDLLLREWRVFRRHHNVFPRLRESLTYDEKKDLKSKLIAKQECTRGSSACTELTDDLLRQ